MTPSAQQLDFLDPLKVQLNSFEGPLELLLELVRKKKMDLQEISLAEICAPYLTYLDMLEEFDMDIAIEFLDIASTLILIKSRALLPKVETEDEDELDLEEQLRQRLIEYQKYKAISASFHEMEQLGRDCFARPLQLDDEPEQLAQPLVIFEELSVYSLVKAYRRALKRKTFHKAHEVKAEELPLEQRILEFMRRLRPGEMVPFEELLPIDPSRPEVVVSFMAILELGKLLLLRLHQVQQYGSLHCEANDKIVEELAFYEDLWAQAS